MVSQTNSVLFWLGVAIELVSTVIQNAGLNLMRLAHRSQRYQLENQLNVPQNRQKTPNFWINPKWWVSIIIFILGVILDFVALCFIPCTVSLPVGSIGIGVNCLCAHYMLKENIFPVDFLGMLVLIAGAFCVVGTNVKDMDLITADRLTEIFDDQESLWFFIGGVCFFVVSMIVSYIWKNAYTYAIAPGTCALFTILFGSCVGQMVTATFKGDDQFGTYQFWLCILGVIAAILLLNQSLQRANSHYDNMIVVPVYFTVTLIVNILSGIFFFKYFSNFTNTEIAVFTIGIVLVCIGCILLSVKHLGQGEIDYDEFMRPRGENTESSFVNQGGEGEGAFTVLEMGQ